MKHLSIRFRLNAAGLQYFNPTDRQWYDVVGDSAAADFLQILNNVTRDYPSQEVR